ncbi:ArgK/MeaB family GTPase [Marinivivus vitaminiproducens]|uniref:ArgK/MeaB family GTPase n=1 Tax=Marinivivus vitaminiproducens TaxID=3035935 RepID=UPI0027997DF9|nr:methylmalonyl Co-A mutase-associated GTPase MeaB [Geminicoccaceae bacterium SCSIO 64248]
MRAGGKRALARALAQIEASPETPETLALLDAAFRDPRGWVLGLTGPPGVGKSTLTSALIRAYRRENLSVGVIAVDPSSRRTGGALLGDRTRIEVDPEDEGVFVRSMAARDHLGGLAALTTAATVLMRAAFDRVIVETVGVGQSETDIERLGDTVLLCIQPGSGDTLQFMKAGIAEIPDVAVVTKGDLGVLADRAVADLRSAVMMGPQAASGWSAPIVRTAAGGDGKVDALTEAIERHRRWLDAEGRLQARRHAQASSWLREAIREQHGRMGLRRAESTKGALALASDESPFARLAELEIKRVLSIYY